MNLLKTGIAVAISLILLAQSNASQASLVGDSVDMHFSLPNLSFDESGTTVVTADASDLVTLSIDGDFFGFHIDPFDSGFIATFFSNGNGFATGNTSFFEFFNLDLQDASSKISGVDISNNDFTLLSAVTSFTDDSVRVNFTGPSANAGTAFLPGEQMTVLLKTTTVPEPSALVIWSLVSLAVVGIRRRRRLSQAPQI